MAPKDKLVKGQRPISSFFFRKPEDKAKSGQKHGLASSAAAQPQSKRQKTAGPQQKRAEGNSQADGTSSLLTDAQIGQECSQGEQEPIDLTVGPDERSTQAAGRKAPVTSRRTQPASYDKEARHGRFQNKLVLGPASGLERDKTVVPQKTTPLEDQVYALKRKHPGILLLIEVSWHSLSERTTVYLLLSIPRKLPLPTSC